MNMLGVLLAGVAMLVIAVLVCFQVMNRKQKAHGKNMFIMGFGGVLLVSSLCVYATLGRWGNWQQAQVDHDVDYLLAAKVNEARRQVTFAPDSVSAQRNLAVISLEAGQYEDAVKAIDKILSTVGEQPDVLGMKVFAQYYRDGRQFTPETRLVIDRVLKLDPLEVQTRMLLGQDAFLNGRYAEAIQEWRTLLDAGAAPGKEQALKNAIAKAEAKLKR